VTAGLETVLPAAIGVFTGTLPLVGVIGWAAFQNNARLGRIEKALDTLGEDLKSLGIRTSTAETNLL